jgi:hypothetical protein
VCYYLDKTEFLSLFIRTIARQNIDLLLLLLRLISFFQSLITQMAHKAPAAAAANHLVGGGVARSHGKEKGDVCVFCGSCGKTSHAQQRHVG